VTDITPTGIHVEPRRGVAVSAETIRRATLALMVFGGAFTMVEPSPYELLGILAFVAWLPGGLRLDRAHAPIALLILAYMSGALVTLVPVMHLPDTVIWTISGWYVALTSIFFMMVLSRCTQERLAVIVRAYVASAVLCAAIGILGYVGLLPGSDALLLYGRVKSTLQDPNVFAPYLVLPTLIVLQRILISGIGASKAAIPAFLILLAGVFLSFSRAGWGYLLGSIVLMTLATWWCAQSRRLRARVVVLSILCALTIALLIVAFLSLEPLRALFEERARLDQTYDSGVFGRFGRHWLGLLIALDAPTGIGMLQFGPRFGEDIHNTYLNAFLSYGWIGGIVFPTIVVLTCLTGWLTCLRPSPWRPAFICVVAAFQGMVLEAWIIDIDHWRHAWLLLGVVWGLAVATVRHEQREKQFTSPAL
jgi:hypothetical protein